MENIHKYISEYFEFVFKIDCNEDSNLWSEKSPIEQPHINGMGCGATGVSLQKLI